MKRWKLIVILFVVVLVGLVVVLCLPQHNDEPSWKGKTLTEWVDRVAGTNVIDLDGEAAKAIKEIGTNGFSTLFKMVKARDGTLKAKLIGMVNGQKLIHVHMKSAHDKHIEAVDAFLCLGTNALPAIPELLKLTQNTDAPRGHTSPVGISAQLCLLSLQETDDEFALQRTLANCLKSSDAEIKRGAGQFLSRFFSKEATRLGVYEIFPDLRPIGTNGAVTNTTPAK